MNDTTQYPPRVTILYNVPIPPEVLEHHPLTEERKKQIQAHFPGFDLSDLAVMDELDEMVRALSEEGWETCAVNINDSMRILIDELTIRRPHVVFNLCESMYSIAKYEAYIAGLYELLSIPYTGAQPEALSTAVRKARTKMILRANRIPTPGYALFFSAETARLNGAFRFPCIVKPSEEDASIGIDPEAIVETEEALKVRVSYIVDRYKQPALVEDYIDGRELNVAILGNEIPEVLPISEIDFTGLPEELPRIVSYSAKWIEESDYYRGTNGKCPAELPEDVEREVKSLAERAFHVIGCRDYARVDFRLTEDMKPFVLEVNPNPDLASDAGFMRSAIASGRTFGQVLSEIVGFALERGNSAK